MHTRHTAILMGANHGKKWPDVRMHLYGPQGFPIVPEVPEF